MQSLRRARSRGQATARFPTWCLFEVFPEHEHDDEEEYENSEKEHTKGEVYTENQLDPEESEDDDDVKEANIRAEQLPPPPPPPPPGDMHRRKKSLTRPIKGSVSHRHLTMKKISKEQCENVDITEMVSCSRFLSFVSRW